jgi:hypothetical protein
MARETYKEGLSHWLGLSKLVDVQRVGGASRQVGVLELGLLVVLAKECPVVGALLRVKQTCVGHVAACNKQTLYRRVLPILQHSLPQCEYWYSNDSRPKSVKKGAGCVEAE